MQYFFSNFLKKLCSNTGGFEIIAADIAIFQRPEYTWLTIPAWSLYYRYILTPSQFLGKTGIIINSLRCSSGSCDQIPVAVIAVRTRKSVDQCFFSRVDKIPLIDRQQQFYAFLGRLQFITGILSAALGPETLLKFRAIAILFLKKYLTGPYVVILAAPIIFNASIIFFVHTFPTFLIARHTAVFYRTAKTPKYVISQSPYLTLNGQTMSRGHLQQITTVPLGQTKS